MANDTMLGGLYLLMAAMLVFGIRVSSGRVANLEVGGIKRSDVGIQVADNDDLNVLGMNFLSSLSRWGVEGRWLVLVS